MFLLNLDDLLNKWYNIEEVFGYTFTWKTLKQNFIKHFSFNIEEENLKGATKHIKEFVQDTSIQQFDQNKTDQGLAASCNQDVKDQNHQLSSQLELENDNNPGKSFQWNKTYPLVDCKVKTTMRVETEKRHSIQEEEEEE